MSPFEHGEVFVLDDGGEVVSFDQFHCTVFFEYKVGSCAAILVSTLAESKWLHVSLFSVTY